MEALDDDIMQRNTGNEDHFSLVCIPRTTTVMLIAFQSVHGISSVPIHPGIVSDQGIVQLRVRHVFRRNQTSQITLSRP